jgi:SAM-dependent methyltransferase
LEPRFTFDRIATLYDEVRAGYPKALFRSLASLVPARAALLEVGCGTGKATAGFAAEGFDIVALDPGASMILEAKSNLNGCAHLRFVQSTFEDWLPDIGSFEMVAAAQAWHWVPPAIGFPKAASLLSPGGVLAIFGNDWTLADPEMKDAIDTAYVRLAPELRDSPLGVWYRADGPLPPMIQDSGLYRDLGYEGFAWSRTMDVATYLDMLRTLSNHQGLDPPRLQALTSAIEQAVLAFGTTVALSYTTHLHHCRLL